MYGVFCVRTKFISCASSVNVAGSCSLEARAANSFHRSKCFDIILISAIRKSSEILALPPQDTNRNFSAFIRKSCHAERALGRILSLLAKGSPRLPIPRVVQGRVQRRLAGTVGTSVH